MAFNPKITQAGLAALYNAESTGVQLELTHVAFGTGLYDPTGAETALMTEVKRVGIGSGSRMTETQIRIAAIWMSSTEVASVGEVGFYAGDVLFAVLSRASGGPLVYKTAGSNLIFSYDWTITAVDAAQISVTVDPDSMALLVHLADQNAHPQYLTIAEYNRRDQKNSVRVATTANITLSGLQTVDGIALAAGDRVLVKNQATAKNNGIYVAGTGAWVRSEDADANLEVTPGMLVPVEQGTANAGSVWQLATDGDIIVGSTSLTFEVAAGPSGIGAGTYRSVTVDKRGRVTGGSNPTTIAGYGLTDAQPLNNLLTAFGSNSGWGVGSQLIETQVDLNEYKTGGKMITPSTGLINLPAGWLQGRHVVEVAGGTNYAVQVLYGASVNIGRTAMRVWSGTSWSAWNEIWHAGNLVKQASLTDATAGAVLVNGAHGLGSSSPTYAADPNLERITGVKSGGGSTATNYPAGASTQYGPLLTLTRGGTGLFQMAMFGSSGIEPELYIRGSNDTGATWSTWRKVWNDANTARLGGVDLPGTAFYEREISIAIPPMSSVAIPDLHVYACDILLFGLTAATGSSTNFVGRFSKVNGAWVATNIYGNTGSSNHPSIAVVNGVPHVVSHHPSAAYTYVFRMSIATQSSGAARPFEFFANLWHTSNLIKQASATDTTAGAMMAVGAFGLGSAAASATSGNADDILVGGFTWLNLAAGGKPEPNSSGQLFVVPGANGSTTSQWFFPSRTGGAAPGIYFRQKNYGDATWQPWQTIWHSGNSDPANASNLTSGTVPVAQLPGAVRNLAQGSTAQDPNSAIDPVIITNHANSPGQGVYWHITTTFYSVISATSNRAQIAVSYNSPTPQMWARTCYQNVWYPWVRCDSVEATPVSTIGHFPLSTAPAGWLKANGAAVSRTTYAALYAAIGTKFGVGNGSTTFNLPDLRGEFLRGWDDGRGVDADRVLGSAQLDALQTITGTVGGFYTNAPSASGAFTVTNGSGARSQGSEDLRRNINFDSSLVTRGGAETRPRNVAMLACIKY